MLDMIPGPSSTDSGELVRRTGSPTVRPATRHAFLLAPTRLLVALDGRRISLQLDNFAHQTVVAHTDQLEHAGSGHVISDDHYAVRATTTTPYEVQRPSGRNRTCFPFLPR